MNKPKILITGGSGFIGTNAMDYALAQDFEILNLDCKKPNKEVHIAHWKKIDIEDASAFRTAILEFKPDYILHLAAKTGMDVKDIQFFSANTEGVKTLLAA